MRKKYNRFFAFGCSYTRFFYPTVGDIMGSNFDTCYNYGIAGAGNRYIFNAIIEANKIHNFTKEDVVYVQWSGLDRYDIFVKDKWILQKHLDKDFYYWDVLHNDDHYVSTLSYIDILKNWFTAANIEYKFSCLTSLESHHNFHHILKDYKDTINVISPSFLECDIGNRERPITINGKKIYDSHHFPWEHYDYVKKFFPEYLPKISNLRQRLIEVYEQSIDVNLNDADQNAKLYNAEWPIPLQRNVSLRWEIELWPNKK